MLKDGQAAVFRCVENCLLAHNHLTSFTVSDSTYMLHICELTLQYGYQCTIRCTHVKAILGINIPY